MKNPVFRCSAFRWLLYTFYAAPKTLTYCFDFFQGVLKSANMFVVTKKVRSSGESVAGESSSDESDDDDLDDDDTIEEEDEEVMHL